LAAAPPEWPHGATGFLAEQGGGGELAEGPLVGGEQLPCAGFGSGQQGADFLVGQPLDVLGVAARGGDDPEVSDADQRDRAQRAPGRSTTWIIARPVIPKRRSRAVPQCESRYMR
ncbi:MAG TPA: hypothetical protein VK162_13280, partial [Streptosporangiaceae bacterium]|nr:hypothetical protein [Streptosporangiaceae bacterium]